MEQSSSSSTATVANNRIHPDTGIGPVSLTVSDLERQIVFQREVLGFKLHWREGTMAGMGAGGADLVQFVEVLGARRTIRVTGLYHYAVLFPDQRALAQAVARLFEKQYPNHPTDHVMTKTTYITDPEGQEIELYAESAEDGTMGIENGSIVVRRADGTPSNGREPLNLEALFQELEPGAPLVQSIPVETRIGHVHLHVRDIAEAIGFYTQVIGFDDMGMDRNFQMGMVSAGGYHHHVGVNTWMGVGAAPAPPDSAGLRSFGVLLPNKTELDRVLARVRRAGVEMEESEAGVLVRDPSRNAVLLAMRTT